MCEVGPDALALVKGLAMSLLVWSSDLVSNRLPCNIAFGKPSLRPNASGKKGQLPMASALVGQRYLVFH